MFATVETANRAERVGLGGPVCLSDSGAEGSGSGTDGGAEERVRAQSAGCSFCNHVEFGGARSNKSPDSSVLSASLAKCRFYFQNHLHGLSGLVARTVGQSEIAAGIV